MQTALDYDGLFSSNFKILNKRLRKEAPPKYCWELCEHC